MFPCERLKTHQRVCWLTDTDTQSALIIVIAPMTAFDTMYFAACGMLPCRITALEICFSGNTARTNHNNIVMLWLASGAPCSAPSPDHAARGSLGSKQSMLDGSSKVRRYAGCTPNRGSGGGAPSVIGGLGGFSPPASLQTCFHICFTKNIQKIPHNINIKSILSSF